MQAGSPVSVMTIVSLLEKLGVVRPSVAVLARLKLPLRDPVFWMSTVPLAVSPGRMSGAVRIAAPALLL
jgi:hypothetical protein